MPETTEAKNGSPKNRVVLGHDQRDRVGLTTGEGARGAVGHVVEVGDRAGDRFDGLRADGGGTVDDA